MNGHEYLSIGAALALAPIFGLLVGGLVSGLDRKLTARMQSRMGPPILQPFYDLAKLLGKEPLASGLWQGACAWMAFLGAAVSLGLFYSGQDMLLIFFTQAVGAVFLVMGAQSAVSPYSQIGAQRELLQIVAYEPLLILAFAGLALETGSFRVDAVWTHPEPLILHLPFIFLALTLALTIKLRKSPFDISGSHHAHQELVRGVHTDYSGPFLALTEAAHWLEVVLLLSVCGLFFAAHWWTAVLLAAAAYLAEIFVDNATSRMTWRWMLKILWPVGLGLALIDLIRMQLGW